jgi:lipoyl(octanoyl) transferase
MTISLANKLIVKQLGQVDYLDTLAEMQEFTKNRDENAQDQLWILEHPPVFTLGQAGKREHLLTNTDIPVIHCDRGGQITYHGPGQIVMYLLLNLRHLQITIRQLVSIIEQAIINTLKNYNINSYSQLDAPGVYVDLKHEQHKICSLGLRVKRGCTYHGLALNYNMNLLPFNFINPCGYKNLKVTQVTDINPMVDKQQIINLLCRELQLLLKYQ